MKLAVLSPKGCSKSAKELAEALGAVHINPYKQRFNHREFDGVFNYGVSEGFYFGNIINHPDSVKECLSKTRTFDILLQAGVPIPRYATKHEDVPPDWDNVVVRTTDTGRGNEGMHIIAQWEGKDIPRGVVYTEYFNHEWEYRVVVFRGTVVGRYKKEAYIADDGIEKWDFTLMEPDAFGGVDSACIKAAAALKIDYVGFDVVENGQGDFVILEANSGPVLTDEAKNYIVKAFKG